MVNDFSGPCKLPTGVDEFAATTAFITSSSVIALAASASGLAWTRTAKCCCPKMRTCATPLIVDRRWAILVSANSSTSRNGTDFDDRLRNRTGESAGFTLMKDGG